MFVREKRIGAYSYLYLVETVRENGKTKQRIIRNLGRTEVVAARGDLDRLARSAARLSQRSMILSLIEGGGMPDVRCRRIGAPLLFERLWHDSGCRAVVEELLAGRRFEFAVERAVFLTVLHRLMVSGSDRACEYWRNDYRIDGIDDLELHHLYRAMIWLGEELPASEQAGRTLVPRCVKDLIEERLFACRRDLFSELGGGRSWTPTATLYFEGRGGDTSAGSEGPIWAIAPLAAPQADDRRHHHGSGRPAGVLGDVAWQHHRRDDADPGDRPSSAPRPSASACVVARIAA